MISRFHYLTQDLEDFSHLEMVQQFCGPTQIDWIQLRMKTNNELERYRIVRDCVDMCDAWNVKLIINDYVELAEMLDVHGVHLGKSDMPIKEARAILGNDKIIGGTANTFEDIKKLYNEGVDYIGVGPYSFTDTKKNLSPVLGLNGYIQIVKKCRAEQIRIPIIAIGGIQLEDIGTLMQTGIHGVAASSAINLAEDKIGMIEQFYAEINYSIALRN